jgi:hypothetical protein
MDPKEAARLSKVRNIGIAVSFSFFSLLLEVGETDGSATGQGAH